MTDTLAVHGVTNIAFQYRCFWNYSGQIEWPSTRTGTLYIHSAHRDTLKTGAYHIHHHASNWVFIAQASPWSCSVSLIECLFDSISPFCYLSYLTKTSIFIFRGPTFNPSFLHRTICVLILGVISCAQWRSWSSSAVKYVHNMLGYASNAAKCASDDFRTEA